MQPAESRSTHLIDARYQGRTSIFYRFHPLYGKDLILLGKGDQLGMPSVKLSLDDVIVRVPEWMTDQDFCRRLRCGADPVPDLSALQNVMQLLAAS